VSLATSALVRAELEKRFGADQAAEIAAKFDRTPLPLLEREDRQRDRDRVHLAIIKETVNGVASLDALLAMAAQDWRDVLVGSGLGNANWPEVLEAAGYPVPQDDRRIG
jgi:hypothetical protein